MQIFYRFDDVAFALVFDAVEADHIGDEDTATMIIEGSLRIGFEIFLPAESVALIDDFKADFGIRLDEMQLPVKWLPFLGFARD